MTVIVYRCDTCKRTKEIQQNITGLETIQRCTITHGCRGKMHQTDVYEDFVRGRLPQPVSGLNDWQQRKMLFNHIQNITRNEWTIPHYMGTSVAVSVFVDSPTTENPNAREKITPTDTIIISKDEIILVFDRAYSGIAQLVARSSGTDIYQPTTSTTTQTEQFTQLTGNGTLSIATREKTNNVKLKLQFQLINTVHEVEYEFDSQPSINSPWVNYSNILIHNNVYQVRSINAIVNEMYIGESVVNGTPFNIVEIDEGSGYRPIESNDAVVLLATSPFEVHDKTTDQYIDCYDFTDYKAYYNAGELYVADTTIQTIYPPIRSV